MAEKELLPYPFGSPRDILTAFFRQKLKILIVFILISLAVAGWVYSKEILYDAEATIILKFGREHIFRPEVGEIDQIVKFNEGAAIETEVKIIQSTDLIRQAIKVIGVQNIYPKLMGETDEVREWQIRTATSKFLGNLESFTDKGNVIKIVFSHQNPKVAAMALNVLIEELREKHLQVFSDPKAAFLAQRLGEYKKDLEDIEVTIQAFKQKHALSAPIVEQQGRLLNQRVLLDSNYKLSKNKLQGLAGKISSLDGQMEAILGNIPVSTVAEGGNLEKAKADLFVLKREEQRILTKYTETSFPVLNLRKEIALMEQFILDEQKSERAYTIASGKKAMYHSLEKERLGAMSEVTTLEASNHVIALQIEDLDKEVQMLEDLSKELSVLLRQRVVNEQNYGLYLKKVEEAKVSEEMDQLKMSNIKVIQAADVPRVPAGRPRKTKLLLGTIFAAIMSVGLGFVLEYFQGGYTRPDQAAEDLGLPILASFSQKG